jgi:hypothetical protein
MAETAGFIGIENVMKNLNKEMQKIKGRTVRGLIEAQIDVHRDMETKSPKIPVDTANLRHSYFAVANTGKVAGQPPSDVSAKARAERDPILMLGFSANYALFVHENLEANFKRKGAGPKYFETHLQNNQDNILRKVQKHAYIK